MIDDQPTVLPQISLADVPVRVGAAPDRGRERDADNNDGRRNDEREDNGNAQGRRRFLETHQVPVMSLAEPAADVVNVAIGDGGFAGMHRGHERRARRAE